MTLVDVVLIQASFRPSTIIPVGLVNVTFFRIPTKKVIVSLFGKSSVVMATAFLALTPTLRGKAPKRTVDIVLFCNS